MKTRRPIVLWSPHSSRHFVVGSQDLRLFEAVEQQQHASLAPGAASSRPPRVTVLPQAMPTPARHVSAEPVSGASVAVPWAPRGQQKRRLGTLRQRTFRIVNALSDVPHIKCLAWSADARNPLVLGAGLTSGKLLLTSFNATQPGVLKEFVPRHSRPCNAVGWNPVDTTQVAVGLEKVRTDFCLLIWDVEHSVGPRPGAATNLAAPAPSVLDSRQSTRVTARKPLRQFANTEATTALSWLPGRPSCLAAGTGFKWLRIYDVRSRSTSPQSVVAHKKAVHGVVFDPKRKDNVATFSDDGVVKVWDTRQFTEPVAVIVMSTRVLSQIAWSPNRPGLLATIAQQERWISLWDVAGAEPQRVDDASSDAAAPTSAALGTATASTVPGTQHQPITTPYRRRFTRQPLACVSWEPPREGEPISNRMLTVTLSGLVEDISLTESLPVALSPTGGVSFASGRDLFHCQATRVNSLNRVPDTGTRMRVRLGLGYSLDISANYRLLSRACTVAQAQTAKNWRPITAQASGAPSTSRAAPAATSSALTAADAGPTLDLHFDEDVYGGIDQFLVHEGSSTAPAGTAATSPTASAPTSDSASRAADSTAAAARRLAARRPRFGEMLRRDDNAGLRRNVTERAPRAPGATNSTSGPATGTRALLADDPTMDNLALDRYQHTTDLRSLRGMWHWLALTRGPATSSAQASAGSSGVCAMLGSQAALHAARGTRGTPHMASRDAGALLPTAIAEEADVGAGSDGDDNGSGAAPQPQPCGIGPFRGLRNESRDAALHLCGWASGRAVRNSASAGRGGTATDGTAPTASPDASVFDPTGAAVSVTGGPAAATSAGAGAGAGNGARSLAATPGAGSSTPASASQAAPGAPHVTDGTHTGRGTGSIDDLIASCERSGRADRAVALAVWHGHLRKAAKTLDRAAARRREVGRKLVRDSNHDGAGPRSHSVTARIDATTKDAELLQLVGMSLAGYPFPLYRDDGAGERAPAESVSELWRDMVDKLRIRMGRRHPYLRAVCSFLYAHSGRGHAPPAGSTDLRPQPGDGGVSLWKRSPYVHVLAESGVALSDRIAFACRFLPNAELHSFLEAAARACVRHGRLQGLLLTGLGERGCALLQGYVDRTGDVQTAALVGCFINGDSIPVSAARRVRQWIAAYRDLLNVWQLWHERARFDVGRASLHARRTKSYTPPYQHALSHSRTSHRAGQQRSATRFGRHRFMPSETASLASSLTGASDDPHEDPNVSGGSLLSDTLVAPSLLHVRCHNCGLALSLPDLVRAYANGKKMEDVAALKPRMLACPKCETRLPRCALCLLPMGCINPYQELCHNLDDPRRDRRRGGKAAAQAGAGRLEAGPTSRNALPFADWWTWCHTCRHGGHASHLAEWFSTHDVCPVSGCQCRCNSLDSASTVRRPSDLLRAVPTKSDESGSGQVWDVDGFSPRHASSRPAAAQPGPTADPTQAWTEQYATFTRPRARSRTRLAAPPSQRSPPVRRIRTNSINGPTPSPAGPPRTDAAAATARDTLAPSRRRPSSRPPVDRRLADALQAFGFM